MNADSPYFILALAVFFTVFNIADSRLSREALGQYSWERKLWPTLRVLLLVGVGVVCGHFWWTT